MALRRRLAHDHGFTMAEMLVVLVVVAALLLIAVASYLGFSGRAETRTAAADVRTAVSSAEAYHTDNDTYTGMTVDALKGYDTGVEVDDVRVSGDGRTYCLDKVVNGKHAFVVRGAAAHTPAAPGSSRGEVDDTGVCPATVQNDAN
ncbi:MAG TPA: prepilin-type N-terminal cleavage/methylation domain-containing protein [Gaiellaceae bacterium]|jgi:prepilin-type N-terminal cleavage/methylation domain-containing protein|nr:prepilin-type N-terminal cleavage/methylation domain-containing protein [Gaiellaceae bacterium]